MICIKVFDFDNTIYRGESCVDLAIYMAKNNRRILLQLPNIFVHLIKYKLCLVDGDKMHRTINDYFKKVIRDKEELLGAVDGFWRTHSHKLDPKMLRRISPEDVIITAGPDFLIGGIKDKLNTDNIISSVVDADKKEVTYFNFGSNKVKRYKQIYGSRRITSFYTDSYNDKALMDISDKVYYVKKGRIKRI